MVANPQATDPVSLNLSLTSNGVIIRSLGSNASAILFNKENTLTGSTTLITVTANNVATRFSIDNSYNNKLISILLTNGTAFEFTLNIATNDAQTLTDAGFNSVSPEKLRRTNLEG
jgi:hypothetical protein